jgi:hypothetical protein
MVEKYQECISVFLFLEWRKKQLYFYVQFLTVAPDLRAFLLYVVCNESFDSSL